MLHILLALADRDRHGYRIMQAVAEQSSGAVLVRTGSFYRHLSRLIDAGLVVEAAGPAQDDPRRGTYYRLTAAGRRALAAEQRRLTELLAAFPSLRRRPRKDHA